MSHLNKTIKEVENKILFLEARMLRLTKENTECGGTILMINRLKDTIEILSVLEEIK